MPQIIQMFKLVGTSAMPEMFEYTKWEWLKFQKYLDKMAEVAKSTKMPEMVETTDTA